MIIFGSFIASLQIGPASYYSRIFQVALVVKILPASARRHKRHGFDPCFRKVPWRRAWQPTPVFVWRIPWTEEPGRLQSIESLKIGHD